jgi:hypothetical protein
MKTQRVNLLTVETRLKLVTVKPKMSLVNTPVRVNFFTEADQKADGLNLQLKD